jgi:hypothetical protein
MRAELVTEDGAEIDLRIEYGQTELTMWADGWAHSASVFLTDTDMGELIEALQIMRAGKARNAVC